MSLPLLHAGRTNPGLSAALDLRFALDKSLTAYRGPTPSFSRASTGSYFDGSGVLRYAALNILTYSEDLANAAWVKSNASISSNVAVSPDGKTTADKLVENTANSFHYAYGAFTGTAELYTGSIYAKSGERSFLEIRFYNGSTNTGQAVFNLSNGTLGTVTAGTASIQSVGNGWYRCSITATMAAASCTLTPILNQSDNVGTYTGDGSSGLFLWGAQVEKSSTVGTYCPTTSSANSAPRFDHTYNGTSWVSRGLLVEEQRTNICLQSSGFSTASWTQYRGTVTANAATSPDGTSNASNFTQSTGQTVLAFLQQYATTTATQFTLSVFAKANGKNFIVFTERLSSAGERYTFFNVSAGSIGTSNAAHTARIMNVGNGWYRCSVTFTALAKNDYFGFNIGDADNSFTCTDSGSVLFYGAMLEAGAFSTSHIETTSASATRSADVCQITGGDFSGFWNGTEGTIVGDFDRLFIPTGTASALYTARDSSNNNAIYYYIDVSNDVSQVYASGASATFDFGSPVGAGISNKIATAYKANDFAASRNGSIPLTDTSGAVPSGQTLMEIGSTVSANYLNGHIARLRYYNKRLPNATLQLLSEPDPTLNLQFALNKTLTPVAGPAPSFSRASTGTYFNASGILTSASINTPRFDHAFSGGQWVSRGLLIEEQRTNGFLRSNEFSNAATWFTTNNLVSTDSTTSPDGTIAFKVTPTTSSNAEKNIFQLATIANSLNTHSIYVKSGTQNFIQLMFTGGDTNYANFNISSGVTGNKSAGVSSSTISDVGNGWYRISVTLTNSGASGFAIFWINSLTDSRAPSTTSTGSIYLFGAQYEIGAFPTSYIGTTSSPVVRSADVCQITGTSFNWMWNQGEGSYSIEYNLLSTLVDQPLLYANNGSVGESHRALGSTATNQPPIFLSRSAGVTDGGLAFGATPIASGKIAIGAKVNDLAGSLNGGAVVTDSTVAMPVGINQLLLGIDNTPTRLNGHIAKLIYYPARLTNTKLQQLST